MDRAGMRLALAAVAVGLLWPAAAAAGTYDVVSCNAPGAGGVNGAWTPAFTHFGNGPHPEAYDLYDDCRGDERALARRRRGQRALPDRRCVAVRRAGGYRDLARDRLALRLEVPHGQRRPLDRR
jgi:hypothetical protein